MKPELSRHHQIKVAERAVRFPPRARRLLLIGIDSLLLPLAVWLSFWLRLAHPLHPSFQAAGQWLLPVGLLVGLPLYAFTGQYKGLTRYVGSRAFYRLAGRNGLLVLLLAATGVMLRLPMPPRSSWILLWLLLTGFTGAVRFALRDLLLSLSSVTHKQMVRVAIYGAGEAGAQLAAALRLAGNHQIVTFLDDAPVLWQRTINAIPIQPRVVMSQVLQSAVRDHPSAYLALPKAGEVADSACVQRPATAIASGVAHLAGNLSVADRDHRLDHTLGPGGHVDPVLPRCRVGFHT